MLVLQPHRFVDFKTFFAATNRKLQAHHAYKKKLDDVDAAPKSDKWHQRRLLNDTPIGSGIRDQPDERQHQQSRRGPKNAELVANIRSPRTFWRNLEDVS